MMGGGITLSERKDGELEDITNTPPKYPRCFIWYDANVGEYFPPYNVFDNTGAFMYGEGSIGMDNNILLFPTKYYRNDGVATIDAFLNRQKGKYKEISLKEFMGECPEGDFGTITISQYFNSNEVYTLLDDEFSKRRINYLKNNIQNKYNTIRIAVEEYGYCTLFTPSCILDKENNCIIFEIQPIPPLGMTTQVRVSLDAEVINN